MNSFHISNVGLSCVKWQTSYVSSIQVQYYRSIDAENLHSYQISIDI